MSEKIVENGVLEEEDFSDEDGFVDDINDEDLLGDILQQKPQEGEAIECCVIIDGIPIVGADKLPRLKTVLDKLFEKLGQINNSEYPLDENGQTKGYVFVEFAARDIAEQALDVFNGYRLDKAHKFQVNSFADLDKFKKPDADWTPPKIEPYNDFGNLQSWLLNKKCMDQFSIQYRNGEMVSISWNNVNDRESSPIATKETWTETVTKWSPQGTYFATFHSKGVAVWAGEAFVQLRRYAHTNVQFLDFSPCETYLVTFAQPRSKWTESADALRIWEVRTGEMKRGFPAVGGTVQSWPYFKWSFDDKFFACMKDGMCISVYETPSFCLLEKKPIKIEGIKDFCWSPKEAVLAYWVGEQGQIPARVALMQFPMKKELRMKNLFNVADAELYWQPNGDHLAVKLSRYGKKKAQKNQETEYSNMTHHLEIFRLRQKDVPVDTMEVKEGIQAFAWEPTGSKFCVLQGSHLKPQAVFYRVQRDGIAHIKSLEAKQGLNTIMWAPAGGWLVLTCLSSPAVGQLIFVDASGSDITVMSDKADHGGATGAAWDPTGRYFCTWMSVWEGRSTDLGYRIWNFQGKELIRQLVEKFCQFQWRPRPPGLLNEQKIKEVKRKLKSDSTYAQLFEMEDQRDKGKASKEILEKRQKQKEEFEEWRMAKISFVEEDKKERIKLRGCDTEREDSGVELEEETIELPLTHEEIVIEATEEE